MIKCLAVVVVVVAALEVPRWMNRADELHPSFYAEVTPLEIRDMVMTLAVREKVHVREVRPAIHGLDHFLDLAAHGTSAEIRERFEIVCKESMLMEFPQHQQDSIHAATVEYQDAGQTVVWHKENGLWEVVDIEDEWVF